MRSAPGCPGHSILGGNLKDSIFCGQAQTGRERNFVRLRVATLMTFNVTCLCLLYLPRQKQTCRAPMLIDLGRMPDNYFGSVSYPKNIEDGVGMSGSC